MGGHPLPRGGRGGGGGLRGKLVSNVVGQRFDAKRKWKLLVKGSGEGEKKKQSRRKGNETSEKLLRFGRKRFVVRRSLRCAVTDNAIHFAEGTIGTRKRKEKSAIGGLNAASICTYAQTNAISIED